MFTLLRANERQRPHLCRPRFKQNKGRVADGDARRVNVIDENDSFSVNRRMSGEKKRVVGLHPLAARFFRLLFGMFTGQPREIQGWKQAGERFRLVEAALIQPFGAQRDWDDVPIAAEMSAKRLGKRTAECLDDDIVAAEFP